MSLMLNVCELLGLLHLVLTHLDKLDCEQLGRVVGLYGRCVDQVDQWAVAQLCRHTACICDVVKQRLKTQFERDNHCSTVIMCWLLALLFTI